MKQITEENIESVDVSKYLYAFADSSKDIVTMNRIVTNSCYQFSYQGTVDYGGWSSKMPTELIREVLGLGYEVYEMTETEYHQWALEQLTGKKWFGGRGTPPVIEKQEIDNEIKKDIERLKDAFRAYADWVVVVEQRLSKLEALAGDHEPAPCNPKPDYAGHRPEDATVGRVRDPDAVLSRSFGGT